MESLAQRWHLIPAQEWNQAHIDIGMIFLVKRHARRVKLARAGTLQYLAGDQKAAEWGEGLISDRRAARKWFLAKEDVPKKQIPANSLSSTWEWPKDGTEEEIAAAGKPAINGVPHTLTYGPNTRLISNSFEFKLEAVLDFLTALFGKMGMAGATADKRKIKDMREHILSDEFKDDMESKWSLRFNKAQMTTALKNLKMKPKAGDELRLIVVTEIACVSYVLSEKSSEMGLGGGAGAEGVGAELNGGFKNSQTDEAVGTTLLLGFRAAEFSVVYPESTASLCRINSWEKGVPLNSDIKAANASSSNAQKQEQISKLMVDILKPEVLCNLEDLFARESEEAEDEQQQVQQDEQREATVGDKRHAAPAEDQRAPKAAKS